MNKRQILQLVILIIVILAGIRFYIYIDVLRSGGDAGVKTGIVEGFLPISALMSLKKFLLTGIYDYIHPAGLTLLIFFLIISIIFKKSFCSHICPVGFVSETLSHIGLKQRINKYLFHTLTILKYGLLAFFVYIILINLTVSAIESFLNAPYNIIADAKMLQFFTDPSRTTVIVLAVILLLTLISKNVWCRVLCPYGALFGLVSVFSPFKVKRSEENCTGCRKCTAACPNDIQVHTKSRIDTPECFGCFDCVNARNCDDCLKVTSGMNHKLLPYVIAVLLTLTVAGAMTAGLWKSTVTNQEYRRHLNVIDKLSH
ncbi:MAG: 4Fe-4S ferredoxin [Denitrovibrio sp.]|nr:MAG: 4Fe-4S ferredoxin [Denitrovibrio sp.]